jgi:hypothetical protein
VKTQPRLNPGKLRRIALEHQGLLKKAPFGRGCNATQKAVEQLGYIQIDTISVVARAHHHVLHTRVPNYQPDHIDKLLQRGSIFEYWYHAAAYLPMRDYRFSLPHMQAMERGETRWIRCRDKKLMRDLLRHVRDEGPTRARDFENPAPGGTSGWWNWKPAKQALDQLFMQGDLMVSGREGFQKIYDLRERVLPGNVDTRMPDIAEMANHLLDNTLRCHGFATRKSMTYLRQGNALREALKTALAQRQEAGLLASFTTASGETVFAEPDIFDRRAPATQPRVRFLSPFDNSLIQRARNQTVFDYDYQIECYLPESKRRYGYFCLPLLYGDRFVGRADCKAHRSNGVFEVKALFVEDPALTPDGEPARQFAASLQAALQEFAQFNACDDIEITATTPAAWRNLLSRT